MLEVRELGPGVYEVLEQVQEKYRIRIGTVLDLGDELLVTWDLFVEDPELRPEYQRGEVRLEEYCLKYFEIPREVHGLGPEVRYGEVVLYSDERRGVRQVISVRFFVRKSTSTGIQDVVQVLYTVRRRVESWLRGEGSGGDAPHPLRTT